MANENFNEHFKAIFEVHGEVPTRGLINTQRFALGAVLVYQSWLCSTVMSETWTSSAG
jgi:hypothetical protein